MRMRGGTLALGLMAAIAALSSCQGRADDAPRAAAAAAASTSVRPRWPVNKTVSYTLELTTVSDTGQSPVAVQLTLVATPEVTFRASGTGYQGQVAMTGVRLLDHAKRDAAGSEQLARELAEPFGFELTSAGQLLAYFQAPTSSAYASGYRRQIAALFQAPPEGALAGAASVHPAKEWDATGLARVEYRATADAKNLTWKRLDYERVLLNQSRRDDSVDASKVKPQIVASSGTLLFDDQGLVELLRREQIRAALTGDKSITTAVDVSLRRSLVASKVAPAAPQLFVPAWRNAADVPISATPRVNWESVMIGGRTFREVMTQYEQWAKTPAGIEGVAAGERATFFRALIGLLKSQPETVSLARRAVDAGSPARSTLIDALGMASTPECSTLLVDLVFDPRAPKETKIRAATALIRAPEPNEAGLVGLERMIPNETFREHGLLGIGTYARLLQPQNRKLAERAVGVLQQELSTAKTARRRALVLLAVANSGASQLFEAALADQASKTPDVRHAAIQAIRLMDDARVEPRLSALLGAADESDVQAALQALGRREAKAQASVELVERLAGSHAAARVRREAVLALVKWRENWPRVEAVIKERNEKDPDKSVRQAAQAVPLNATAQAPI